jgi:hypothetical protein
MLRGPLKLIQASRNKKDAWRQAELAFSDPATPPILIYQMGKVASSTVYKSLAEASLTNSILQIHFLSNDLPEHRETIKEAGIDPPPFHIFLGEALSEAISKHPASPINIISLVRDPVAFVVSDIFQNPYFASESIKTDEGKIDPVKALDYIERELRKPETFSYVYEWFDRELKTVFGIDVFARPFPTEDGYGVYSNGKVRALVIRLEDLSERGPKAMQEFLSLKEPLVLKQSNVRAETEEADTYREVMGKLSLSPSLCREIYSSSFVKHFYNEELISKFISKWTKSS